MIIRELIDILGKYPPEELIAATWEGQVEPITVYRAANGPVLLDADGCYYRSRFEQHGLTEDALKALKLSHADD